MKKTLLVLLVAGFLPRLLLAGEVFGIITEGATPVPNARVDVSIADKVYTATTDARGSYRVYVPENGKARLTVTVGSTARSTYVFSSERPARYDLVIVGSELRRR